MEEAEFNKKLEEGYEDMIAGRTKDAKEVFAEIRKDYGIPNEMYQEENL